MAANQLAGGTAKGQEVRTTRDANSADEQENSGCLQGETAMTTARKPSDERLTEDDMQREKLGPRGVPGQADPAKMVPQQRKNIPKSIEPGHTA